MRSEYSPGRLGPPPLSRGDSDHEEHESMLEWIGHEFDPETFDLEEVNRTLKPVR